MNSKVNDQTLWKLTKKRTMLRNEIPPIHFNVAVAYSIEDKVNSFGAYFQSVHELNKNMGPKYFDRIVHNTVNRFLRNNQRNFDDAKLATPKEIVLIIKNLKKTKPLVLINLPLLL